MDSQILGTTTTLRRMPGNALVLLLLLLVPQALVLAQTRAPSISSYCNADFSNVIIPPCQDDEARSLLFLMDGSNSLDQDNFYTDLLDYTLAIYCAFAPQFSHQIGMLIFSHKVEPIIPLDRYTRAQWKTKVEEVRSARTACCSCCTPTADVFDLANAHFAERALPGNLKIAMTITDGVPSNNNVGSDGNPDWLWKSVQEGFNPAQYNYVIVPERAAALRDSDVRLMLLAVPSADGSSPDQRYFNGGYSSGSRRCVTRSQVEFCAAYRIPPFPITTLPIVDNSFSAVSFNLQRLLDLTVEKVCKIPTPSPTFQPTSQAPTKLPTKLPTSQAPTKLPTPLPTQLPTSAPTYIYMDQVDLHILMDHSKSMWWRDAYCRAVVPPGDVMPDSDKVSACWNLWINFVRSTAIEVSNMVAGIDRDRRLGWAADFPNSSAPAKGLRISLVGFACQNKQKSPKTFPFSYQFNNGQPMLTSLAQLDALLDEMRVLRPDGGTCPGMAIEEVVRYVEDNSQADYPLQAVVLLSDGVFYDRPFPAKATTGLEAYKAMRFTVGVAVNDLPLDKVRKNQVQDLRSFAGDESRFYNLNSDGWAVLRDVATKIAIDLPKFMIQGKAPIPRYTWCGWRRAFACTGNGEPWRANKCAWKGKKTAQWKCARNNKK